LALLDAEQASGEVVRALDQLAQLARSQSHLAREFDVDARALDLVLEVARRCRHALAVLSAQIG
jgi:hypothetical protein